MADFIVSLRHWSHKRQSLGKRGNNLDHVLRDVLGVYSSHPSGPLSLMARVKSFSQHAFNKLDTERLVLRVPAMRESVYVLPADTARMVVAATLPPVGDPYWQKRYSQKGRAIPSGKFAAWKKLVIKATVKPLLAAEINEIVGMPDATVKPVLNRMGFEGLLLRVGSRNLRSNKIRYVATQSWAKHHVTPQDPAKALTWLAGEYLRAFGPARIKDFQWWSGVTATKAKSAIESLDAVEVDPPYLILARDNRAFGKTKRPKADVIDLLPQWDCYTMGYAPDGRERFVDAKMQKHIYGSLGATGGNALGTVLVNGLAHGSWSSRFKADQMHVTLKMFLRPSQRLAKHVTGQFEEIANVLAAKSLSIQTG